MPLTELKRHYETFLEDKSASDNAQVPLDATAVSVFYRGATVSSSQTINPSPATATVNVYDIGALAVGDTLQVGTTSSPTLEVSSITSATAVVIKNNDSVARTLNQYDRLLVQSRTPTVYRDVTGTQALSPVVTDSRGQIEFYSNERFFDYIVGGSLYQDRGSGQARSRRWTYNVMDFTSVAAALAAIPSGSRLYFPPEGGPYVPPTAAGWSITKPVEIFSDGMSIGEDKGFQPYAAHKDSRVFDLSSLPSRDFYLHDTVISSGIGIPAAGGVGDHIYFGGATTISRVMLERCWLLYAGRSGIYFDGSASGAYVVGVSLRDVYCYGNGGHGAYLNLCTFMDIGSCGFSANQGMGLCLVDCSSGVNIHGCNFESNGDRLTSTITTTFPQVFGSAYNAQLYLTNCDGAITGCNIEDAIANPTYTLNGITLNACKGVIVGGNEFDNVSSVANSISVQIINGTSACTILPNMHSAVDITANISNNTTEWGNVIHPQMCRVVDATAKGRVAFGANGRNFVYVTDRTQANGQANNKGVGILLPNLGTADATISTTDAGNTITTAEFEGTLAYSSVNNKLYVLTAANTWTAQT